MRKSITFLACFTLIGTLSIVSSCKKKPEIKPVDEVISASSTDSAVDQEVAKTELCVGENCPDAGDEVSAPSTDSTVEQEDAKVELCGVDGNCPCGDGFCAQNSVCIKDKCFCGAFLEKGFIDDHAIVSNSYGEFECARFITEDECTVFDTDYDFICTRSEGCKIKDGRVFPFMNLSKIEPYSFNGMYLIPYSTDLFYDYIYDIDDTVNTDNTNKHFISPSHSGHSEIVVSRNRNEFVLYEDLIREHRLNTCEEPLPTNLKYLDRSFPEEILDYNDIRDYVELDNRFELIDDFEVPSDLECDTRISCNVIGVTPEHINEYICEIGIQYSAKCYLAVVGRAKRRAIGLRCIQPEGCTCGNSHCPEHALCKDGLCTYDIYYENRVCPDKSWDNTKSDIENYMKIAKNCDCKNKVSKLCLAECDPDNTDCSEFCKYSESQIERCSEECYWNDYYNTITKTDPCKSKKSKRR